MPLVGRVELGGESVGVGALADEVVLLASVAGRVAIPAMCSLSKGSGEFEEHDAVGPLREPQRDVLDDRAAEITAAEDDSVEAEVIVDEGVEVAAVRGYVVESGCDVAVAEPGGGRGR